MAPIEPDVHRNPGTLPAFWKRSAVFFANLRALFYGNREETDALVAAIEGIDSYGGRLVPIIDLLYQGRQNILVLERRPVASLLQYFSEGLGLTLPRIETLHTTDYEEFLLRDGDAPVAVQRIRAASAEWVDGFVTDARLVDVAVALGKHTVCSLDGSRTGNNKRRLHDYLAEQGLPVFDTFLAEDRTAAADCAGRLRAMGYTRAVVKAEVGASGIGMARISTETPELSSLAAHLFHAGPAMVQGWLDESMAGVSDLRSPSVQLFVDDTRVHIYDVTEQILSTESIHEGNMAPPPYMTDGLLEEMLRQAEIAGKWLYTEGYRGTASADFLLLKREGRDIVHICEVNARVTGATYPAMLARHLAPGGSWLMRNLRLRSVLEPDELLRALAGSHTLFKTGAARGVIPINLNLDRDEQVTKGQFLCLGPDLPACEKELTHAQDVLPVELDYDRD